jgi:hypothetical protein
MLLGSIGNHIKKSGLDAIGLGGLLGEQKQHLAGALPSGLTQNLGFGNLLSGAGDLGKSAVDSAKGAASSASRAANNAANDAAAAGGGLFKILLPLLAIAALAYFAWTFLAPAAQDAGDKAGQLLDKGKQAAGDLAEEGKKAVAGALDFKGLDMSALGDAANPLKKGFSDITTGFAGLKESGADGAKKLATTITDFSGSVGDLGLGDLPDAGKGVAKTMIGQFIDKVKSLLGLQSDSIQGILKPAIDMLMDKLKPFG